MSACILRLVRLHFLQTIEYELVGSGDATPFFSCQSGNATPFLGLFQVILLHKTGRRPKDADDKTRFNSCCKRHGGD